MKENNREYSFGDLETTWDPMVIKFNIIITVNEVFSKSRLSLTTMDKEE